MRLFNGHKQMKQSITWSISNTCGKLELHHHWSLYLKIIFHTTRAITKMTVKYSSSIYKRMQVFMYITMIKTCQVWIKWLSDWLAYLFQWRWLADMFVQSMKGWHWLAGVFLYTGWWLAVDKMRRNSGQWAPFVVFPPQQSCLQVGLQQHFGSFQLTIQNPYKANQSTSMKTGD